MRVLVYGAGTIGSRVLCQLRKNPAIGVVTVDPRGDDCEAVERGIIDGVDIEETLTPLNVAEIVGRADPDLVLVATASEDLGLGHVPGVGLLMDALREEVEALAGVPVIEVARRLGSVSRKARR
jgi:threonine dehydrogenase-like Zn-dependent dehydrogenase